MPPSREEIAGVLASRARMADLYRRARNLHLVVSPAPDRRGIRVWSGGPIPRDRRLEQLAVIEELTAREGEMFDFIDATEALFAAIFGDGRPRPPRRW
jgi:hypothetical protein